MIIVSDALHVQKTNASLHVTLHPTLAFKPSAYRVEWFNMPSHNPLAWYAWLHRCAVTACLLPHVSLHGNMRQCWLASPYHGQLQGHRFRVMAEAELDWHTADAHALCQCLNPMLAEENMRLEAVDGFLLLLSTTIIHATPPSLAQLEDDCLPNRLPQGKDGLQLMRIMGDIQTQLYQTPLQRATNDAPSMHGLWLSDAMLLPFSAVNFLANIVPPYQPLNQASNSSQKKSITIKTVKQCNGLNIFSKNIILAGDGLAAMLSPRPAWQCWLMPKHSDWVVHQLREEKDLHQRLQHYAQ